MKFILAFLLIIFFIVPSLPSLGTEGTDENTSAELASSVLDQEMEGRDPFASLLRLKEESMKKKKERVLPTDQEFPVVESRKLVTDSDFELLGVVWNQDGEVALLAKDGLTWAPLREGQRIEETPYRVIRIEGKIGEVLLWADNEIIRLTFGD